MTRVTSWWRELSAPAKFRLYSQLTLQGVVVVVAIVAAIVHSHASVQRAIPSRWSIPTHFTIPILSPFTSVVSILLLRMPQSLKHKLLGLTRDIDVQHEAARDLCCDLCRASIRMLSILVDPCSPRE